MRLKKRYLSLKKKKKVRLKKLKKNARLRGGIDVVERGLLQLMDIAARLVGGSETNGVIATMAVLTLWTSAARSPNMVISNASFQKIHALHHLMFALEMLK